MADTFSAPRPAMPSKPLPNTNGLSSAPTFDAPTVIPVKQRHKRKAKTLPAAEIKKIKAKRARALRAKAPAKNHNRPLELKSQLEAVLMLTSVLKKPELEAFASIAGTMQKLSRGSRKNVIGALERVYL